MFSFCLDLLWRSLIVLILSALVSKTQAEPAYGTYGLFPVGSTRVLGMGGAFVGLADDASAVVTNPAGLSMAKWRVDLGGGTNRIINREVDVNGDEFKDGLPYTSVFTTGAVRVGSFGLGLNYGTPYKLDYDFGGSSGSLRLIEIQNYDLAVAVNFIKNFSLGVSARLEKAKVVYQDNFNNLDLSSENESVFPVVGLLYRLDKKLGLGITWSPERRYDIDETLNSQLGGEDWFHDLVIPEKLTLGASLRMNNRLSWVGDLDFYSPVKEAYPVTGQGTSTGPLLERRQSLIHGGFEYSVLSSKDVEFIWRGGGYKEPKRVLANKDRFHFTMGVEARFGPLVFAAAYDQGPDFSNVAQSVSLSLGAL